MQNVGIDPGRGFTQAVGPRGERVLFPSLAGAPSEAYYAALLGDVERNGRYRISHVWWDGDTPHDVQLERIVGIEADTDSFTSWSSWHRQRPDEDLFAFVAAALYRLGVEGDVAMAIGSPVAYYPSEHETLAAKLAGSWTINGRQVNVRRVAIVPEPACAVYHLGLTHEGKIKDIGYFRKKVAVLDIGMHSTDGVLFEGGRYKAASCFTVQIATRQILEAISRHLGERYSVNIPPHRLAQELRAGWISLSTVRVDLSKVIQQAIDDNTPAILSAATGAWADEPGIEEMLLIGGGSYSYGPAMKAVLPFRVPDEPEWSVALGLRAYVQFAFEDES